ncbi:MAG: hypothetical protein AAF191_05370 [Verrucomicrobiota bacterium]
MPNINLSNGSKRDAVVQAQSIRQTATTSYIDEEGAPAVSRKVLKSTMEQDYSTLLESYGDPRQLGQALVDGDPEVDLESFGMFLSDVSRVYLTPKKEIVYRIEQFEVIRNPDGSEKERRPRMRPEANIDSEIPLTWTGKKIPKGDAIRRFVFASKLQIQHVNGLTYDFLYAMAKELAEEQSLLLLGGGEKGKDPLVFRRGAIPYRGFLEGRIVGEQYVLLLHLSNMELKKPEDRGAANEEKPKAKAKAAAGKKKVAGSPKQKSPATKASAPGTKKSPTKKAPATKKSTSKKTTKKAATKKKPPAAKKKSSKKKTSE